MSSAKLLILKQHQQNHGQIKLCQRHPSLVSCVCASATVSVPVLLQLSAPGSTFLGTLASEAWEEQRVRLNEGGHFVGLKKYRVWAGPNKLAGVSSLVADAVTAAGHCLHSLHRRM